MDNDKRDSTRDQEKLKKDKEETIVVKAEEKDEIIVKEEGNGQMAELRGE